MEFELFYISIIKQQIIRKLILYMITNKIIFNLLSRKKLGKLIVLGKAGKLLRYTGGAREMILIRLLRCLLMLMEIGIMFCCQLCLSILELMDMLQVVQIRIVLEL